MAALKIVLTVLFVIAAIAIIIIVLLQEGKSAGLGSLNGGMASESYWDRNKKNTLEGKFERWTKLTAAFFIIFALGLMLITGSKQKTTNKVTVDPSAVSVETPSAESNETASPAAEDSSADISAVTTDGKEVDENGNVIGEDAAQETAAESPAADGQAEQ